MEQMANLVWSFINDSLTCCQKLVLYNDPDYNRAPVLEMFKSIQNLQYQIANDDHVAYQTARELERYREQGTVEECTAALAHLQACDYATKMPA
jgi:hypothetical protein